MEDPLTWRDVVAETTSRLGSATEARWLCEHASGLDGTDFDAELSETPTTVMMKSLDAMVARRLAGEPLQYVMSRWAFRHLDLFVDRRVLIPRPETELIVELVLDRLDGSVDSARVVDLGTGSGAIGLSVAFESHPRPVEVWLTDDSTDALDVARANLASLGRRGARVQLAHGSWWSALPESLARTIDVAVCNPPYIAVGDPEVSRDVVDWEPEGALFGGVDGLDDLRVVIAGAPSWLCDAGSLVVEIGHRQADSVTTLMDEAGFVGVTTHRDLTGRDRFVSGRLTVSKG